MEINKNGKSIYIKKEDDESYDIYYDRMWFIISQEEINDDIDRMSKIWINIKYRKCRYSPYLYNKVINMEKKMKKINL